MGNKTNPISNYLIVTILSLTLTLTPPICSDRAKTLIFHLLKYRSNPLNLNHQIQIERRKTRRQPP